MSKIAVVTGGNKGIGYAICKGLASYHENGASIKVILGSRDEAKGREAAEVLKKEGLSVVSHQLDVSKQESVDRFAEFVKKEYGRCDILVNNAGVGSDLGVPFMESSIETIKEITETNTYGVLRMIKAFYPMMKVNNYGRIVNVSSGAGQLSDMNGKSVGYRLSKVSLNALTKIVADESKGTNILINATCPGFVDTDMTKNLPGSKKKTPDEGAATAVWLATQPDNGVNNGFFRDMKPIPW